MGFIFYLFHPNQAKAMIQWKLWHEPIHKRNPKTDAPTLQTCFHYLRLTSRSFAAVIQELHPELLNAVTVFYLVLRGLDTIEDDMTIDNKEKEPLLRNFHKTMAIEGWTFDGNGPNEKDRDLLVHFDAVVVELQKIKPEYYEIIENITTRMGNGMADYALNAEHNINGVNTVKDYEKYCHYVAGLVGEGLTRLFVRAELANPRLLEKPHLSESMGQFLQKTNIIRDIREDWDDARRFWPKEIWGKYFDNWDDIFKPENRETALLVSSEMVLNALKHAEDCLFYMAGMKDQSVFNFVAIPQTMAIATLELVFRNPAMFDRNIKMTRGVACELMIEATQNLFTVCEVFRKHVRRIHKKNDPRDPSYIAISTQCGRIEQFIETLYPRQTAKKAYTEYHMKGRKELGMDPGEGAILVLVMVLSIGLVCALMFLAAWGSNIFFTKYFPDDAGVGNPQVTMHEEL